MKNYEKLGTKRQSYYIKQVGNEGEGVMSDAEMTFPEYLVYFNVRLQDSL